MLLLLLLFPSIRSMLLYLQLSCLCIFIIIVVSLQTLLDADTAKTLTSFGVCVCVCRFAKNIAHAAANAVGIIIKCGPFFNIYLPIDFILLFVFNYSVHIYLLFSSALHLLARSLSIRPHRLQLYRLSSQFHSVCTLACRAAHCMSTTSPYTNRKQHTNNVPTPKKITDFEIALCPFRWVPNRIYEYMFVCDLTRLLLIDIQYKWKD